MIFGYNKHNLNQETFNLGIDQIEITLEYKYLGICLYLHGHFEPSSKRRQIVGMEALMATLTKEAIIIVTFWELKSQLFKASGLLTSTHGFEKLSLKGFSRRA